jgi:hypothetical protein
MMNPQQLIVHLIRQDLRHHQLILGLEALGLSVEMHYLELHGVIAQLMGIEGELSNEWLDTYMRCMERAPQYPITGRGDNLLLLAEECYQLLKACRDANS